MAAVKRVRNLGASDPSDLGKRSESTVIIVGDWIIDHYYFLKPNEATAASARGFAHYDIVSEAQDMIRDLSGAGHVAHLLFSPDALEIPHPSDPARSSRVRLVGLGIWNDRDTELMRHLVHANLTNRCPAAQLGATAAPEWERCPIALSDDVLSLRSMHPMGTTQRVMRTYQLRDGAFEQLDRLDLGTNPDIRQPATSSLNDVDPDSVVGIVVHDMAHGTVTSGLVTYLSKQYPQAQWFVRSKSGAQGWIKSIGGQLRFLLLGPELLRTKNPLDTWVLKKRLTPQAIDLIKSVKTKGTVALLTNSGELMARLAGGDTCITIPHSITTTPVSQLRWASSVFATVVMSQLRNPLAITGHTLAEAVYQATELRGIPEIDVPPFMQEPLRKLVRGSPPIQQADVLSSAVETSWKRDVDAWSKARHGHGTLLGEGSARQRLEVWRGAPILPGYITIVDERIEIVLELARLLREFVDSGGTSPASVLLQSDPGTGKTALAEALAMAIGARLIRDDISRMTRREQVRDIFDAIAAVQSVDTGPVLVFVDEINALVEQSPVFSQFLGPLDQKPYARAGGTFQLRPCAWLFTGTHVPDTERTNADKLSDFRSRLTTRIEIDYASLIDRYAEPVDGVDEDLRRSLAQSRDRLEKQAKLEQVYVGASRIGRRFPHVTEVSREVLDVFYTFDPGGNVSPSRRIGRLVEQIRSVQGYRITRSNCEYWKGVYWSGVKTPVAMDW